MMEFMKEVDIISGLRHPNILSFTGICIKPACLLSGMENWTFSLIDNPPTEFMSRGSVWQLIHSKVRKIKLTRELKFSVAMWVSITVIALKNSSHTAQGMEYLHSVNIIHRDLKPHNLLVSCLLFEDFGQRNWPSFFHQLNDEFVCKVADFGLARTKVSTTMTKVGTPRWVAPEVLRDEHYTEKADVYRSQCLASW